MNAHVVYEENGTCKSFTWKIFSADIKKTKKNKNKTEPKTKQNRTKKEQKIELNPIRKLPCYG